MDLKYLLVVRSYLSLQCVIKVTIYIICRLNTLNILAVADPGWGAGGVPLPKKM